MPCYHPLKSWNAGLNTNGKMRLVFKDPPHYAELVLLPCGSCIGCRLERSRQWALRCMHEASLHTDNSFLTLTYSPENLPKNSNLEYSDFQKFLKKYRKNENIRYYMCGEYGGTTGRPHYHAIIFGHEFKDKKFHKLSGENKLYTSETLDNLWSFGDCYIGDVTFESAAYCARYCTKKVTGKAATEHYERIDPDTGEIYNLTPEFNRMSLKPGIAAAWWEKYHGDLRKDFITSRGVKMKPPKYYDTLLERNDPERFEIIKENRKTEAVDSVAEAFNGRLEVKEKCKTKQIQTLYRKLE